jgi:hypothetical protein
MCRRVVDPFIIELIQCKNHEIVLAAGTLSTIKAAVDSVSAKFHDLLPGFISAMESIIASVVYADAQGMSSRVEKVIASGEADAQDDEEDADEEEGVTLADPPMLVYCLHSLQDVLQACSSHVSAMIKHGMTTGMLCDSVFLRVHVRAQISCTPYA